MPGGARSGARGRRENWLGRNGIGCGGAGRGLWAKRHWEPQVTLQPWAQGLEVMVWSCFRLVLFLKAPVGKFPLRSELVSLSGKWG